MGICARDGRQQKGDDNEYEGEEELIAPPKCNAIYCQLRGYPGLVM